MPAEGRENHLLKKGNSDAFFREKYLTKNTVTGRKYHYNPLPVIAFGADAPHRLIHEPGNLSSFFCGVKKFP